MPHMLFFFCAYLIWGILIFQECLLNNHEVTCMLTFGDNMLLTGCADGSLIQWDIEKSLAEKV